MSGIFLDLHTGNCTVAVSARCRRRNRRNEARRKRSSAALTALAHTPRDNEQEVMDQSRASLRVVYGVIGDIRLYTAQLECARLRRNRRDPRYSPRRRAKHDGCVHPFGKLLSEAGRRPEKQTHNTAAVPSFILEVFCCIIPSGPFSFPHAVIRLS